MIDPYFADRDVTLYHGDVNVVLPLLEDVYADAVVTSPPYLDVRDDVTSPFHNDPFGHLDWLDTWLAWLGSRIRPTGSLMLNLGRIHREGVEVPFAEHVLARAKAVGWKHLDTIIWHKVNGGGGRATSYLLDRHEYVYWLALTTDPYKGFDEARQPYSPATLERYSRSWSTRGSVAKNVLGGASEGREAHPDGALPGSVFACSVGADKGIAHPTPMALDLALHLIRLACPPGGIVLDPFGGSGTTGVAARLLGRHAVLVELEEKHCAEAAARLGQQTLPLSDAEAWAASSRGPGIPG